MAGNGQNELVEAITGLRRPDHGEITVCEVAVAKGDIGSKRKAGLAYIPEDRHRVGTAAGGEVWANLLMGYQRASGFRKGRFIRRSAVQSHARKLITDYDIRVGGPDTSVATLSGGNLQKVVVGREMAHAAPLLVAEQPTRGSTLEPSSSCIAISSTTAMPAPECCWYPRNCGSCSRSQIESW